MPAMVAEPKRILVVLPTWVGDVVMATPTLAALRRRFGQAHIACFGGRVARDVLAGLTLTDEFLEDPSKAYGLRLRGAIRAGRLVRAGRFDAAVLLSNAFRVAMICRLGRAGRLVGYDRDSRGWLLNDRLQAPRCPDGRWAPIPAIQYYLALAQRMGCDPTDRAMHLAVEPVFQAQADFLFRQAEVDCSKPIVLLNPGASFGSSKLYPADRYAAVADALHERHGAQIIINAAPSEKPIAAAVAEAMRHRPAISFAQHDNTLGLLKAVTARSTLMITNDTGPRHIAAALGIGVVTIFGATDPDWTTIDCPRERIVHVAMPCGPCQKKLCPRPEGDEYLRCLKSVAPEQVIAAAEELLCEALPEDRA